MGLSVVSLDEIEIPESDEIMATPHYIYLVLCEGSSPLQLNDFGLVWKGTAGEKRLVGVLGDPEDCGPFVRIGDAVYFPNGKTEFFRLEGVSDLVKSSSFLPDGWEIYDVGTDGSYLYLEIGSESGRSQKMHVMDTRFRPITSLECECEIGWSGSDSFFRADEDIDTNIYKRFQMGKLVDKIRFDEEGSWSDLFDSICAGDCGTQDFPFHTFTDGKQLYVLSKFGDLWHLSPNGNTLLQRGDDEVVAKTGGTAHNNRRAILFNGTKIRVFGEGRLLGTSPLFGRSEGIDDVAYSGDFAYTLKGTTLQRYHIVDD